MLCYIYYIYTILYTNYFYFFCSKLLDYAILYYSYIYTLQYIYILYLYC